MARRALGLAVVLLVCMAGPAGAQEHMTTSELEARFGTFMSLYTIAAGSGDYDTAETHWNVMREAARTLVGRGLTRYASYDRPMDRPDARPRVTPVVPDPPPTPEPARPVTVQIAPELEIEVDAGCYEPVVVGVDESQTGFEEDLTEIELVVYARLLDRNGVPVATDSLAIEPNVDGAEVHIQSLSEFTVTLVTQGFENLRVAMDLVLDGPCLVVDPVVVGLGTLYPGTEAYSSFAVANTCDAPLEMTMPTGPELTFDVRDCSGGTTNLGSAVQGDDQRALLGPDARCEIRVTWRPEAPDVLNSSHVISTDEDLPLDCWPNVRVVGTSSDCLMAQPRELRFDRKVFDVGTTGGLAIELSNACTDREVTIEGFQITGPHQNDFRLGTVRYDGASDQGGATVLHPEGVIRALMEFTPSGDGFRVATYTFWIADPDTPAVRIPMTGLAEDPAGAP